MSYVFEDYWLCIEPEMFYPKFDDEGFPDVTDDREQDI